MDSFLQTGVTAAFKAATTPDCNLHHPGLAQVGAVDHAAVAKRIRIDDRWIAGDQVGGRPPRRRPDAEAVTAVAGGKVEAGQGVPPPR